MTTQQDYSIRINWNFPETPVDRNDPEAAGTALPLYFPPELSQDAWRVLDYLDDTAWLFAYKGKLVVTDESLELSVLADQRCCGGPRWTGDSFAELDAWLTEEAQYLEEEEDDE